MSQSQSAPPLEQLPSSDYVPQGIISKQRDGSCTRIPLNTGNTVTHFLERVMIGTSGGLGFFIGRTHFPSLQNIRLSSDAVNSLTRSQN